MSLARACNKLVISLSYNKRCFVIGIFHALKWHFNATSDQYKIRFLHRHDAIFQFLWWKEYIRFSSNNFVDASSNGESSSLGFRLHVARLESASSFRRLALSILVWCMMGQTVRGDWMKVIFRNLVSFEQPRFGALLISSLELILCAEGACSPLPNSIKPKIWKAPSQNCGLRGGLDDPQQSADATQHSSPVLKSVIRWEFLAGFRVMESNRKACRNRINDT